MNEIDLLTEPINLFTFATVEYRRRNASDDFYTIIFGINHIIHPGLIL